MTSPAHEGQTFRGVGRLVAYANLVKLPHTVFALPFALVGVVLASRVTPVNATQLLWVVVAFTAARFVAMAFNRVVDRAIDARNPRTAMREIPRGVVGVREAWVAIVVMGALFVFAAARLNPLCLRLAPVALAWVCFYSLTKRFTHYAHLVLGLGLAIAPVGGYLAVTGAWSTPWWTLIALTVAVMSWVAGFDILYALADAEFDRREGLHSIPAALGVPRAITVSRVLHVLTVIALAVGLSAGGGRWLAAAAVAFAAALLRYEHRLVRADDLSKLDAAFFTMNGVISIGVFLFVLADRMFLA
ncbi:MAG: putative 4-hydroxybenzoate polyprenyltransferase [Gemmatimonadaceae bacterium]|nr:putative 4-hydroxybenzoate polyprenyltransferase [Gemmatimonadaceae bacterium]